MNGTTVIILVVVVMLLILQQRLGGARAGDVQAALQKGGRLIDVRTPDEFRSGHLAAAVNIPLADLQERVVREFPDKDTPLLLHCASGARSAAGRRVVAGLGYHTVLNLGSYSRAAKLVADKTP